MVISITERVLGLPGPVTKKPVPRGWGVLHGSPGMGDVTVISVERSTQLDRKDGHPFHRHLLSTCRGPGFVLGTGDAPGTKTKVRVTGCGCEDTRSQG